MEAVASGQWSVASCQWSVASGRLPVVGCQWSVASGRLPVVGCQWSVASGRLPVVGCRWSVAGGRLPVVGCQWSVASGRLPGTAGGGRRWSKARSAGDAHAWWRRPRWHHRPAGTTCARWLCSACFDTSAGMAHAQWHSYRGALRGESPHTREGRNGPTVQGQWIVGSG